MLHDLVGGPGSCNNVVPGLTHNMSQHVATGWPNLRNMLLLTMLQSVAFKCCHMTFVWLELANAGPTMLGYVALRCCDHLTRALHQTT